MKDYPNVIGEFDTLAMVLDGRSIARYGDGEFKMAANHYVGIKSQVPNTRLASRLEAILRDGSAGECLVGIPNIRSATPKADFWNKHARFCHLLGAREYVSSFITRPDSAPWIDIPEYWAMVESLWRGKHVTLVRGSSKSFTAERLMLAGAARVTEVLTAGPQHAYTEYDQLLERIGRPETALLCLGPTATVMAVDLCARGVHAIDCGHLGMFYKKHLEGLPMWVNEADKVQA